MNSKPLYCSIPLEPGDDIARNTPVFRTYPLPHSISLVESHVDVVGGTIIVRMIAVESIPPNNNHVSRKE